MRAGLAAVTLVAALLGDATATGSAVDPGERLERIRDSPTLSSDPAAIEELAREAESFPRGQVRVQARMLVADAWLTRLRGDGSHVARAIDLLREVRDDPAADAVTARLAAREAVEALVSLGRVDEAAAEATAHADRLDPGFLARTKALVRRRAIRGAAILMLATIAVLSSVTLASAIRAGRLG